MLLSKKLLFYQNLFPKEFYAPGHYQTYMIPGTYYVITRSAGGAGGTNGTNGVGWGSAVLDGGTGGAGGSGKINSRIITITDFAVADIYVGSGGLAVGGNGGGTGDCAGGGGGEPSYVIINDSITSANAGGGGGGGGGAGQAGRNAGSRQSGSGGGYYRLEYSYDEQTGVIIPSIVSIAGKTGVTQANGIEGNTADFPNIYSGNGKGGQATSGYAGANGGGASGGGAGRGTNDGGSYSGGAGGGAGGSEDAGGGTGGTTVVASKTGDSGYNAHTIPTDTTAENAEYGIIGDYGIGGTTATDGQGGCVVIRLVNTASDFMNLGDISTLVPAETDDAGSITGTTESSDDAGLITGTVESSDDAGTIYTETESTPWALGLITETVSETTNCGNIM